jgi:geranylgeranyl diphosphate synthase type I
MTNGTTLEIPTEMRGLADRIDRVLEGFLHGCATEADGAGDGGAVVVEEISRLIRAGGKRLRPAFCYWGFRAAGGDDGDAIVRAAAAMELLHTMALVHDDLLDDTDERRGVPTTRPWMAGKAADVAPGIDPGTFATSAAVLVGDLAAVLADRLLLESGFDAEALARALGMYHHMRIETAVGQFLDIAGRGGEPERARDVARLKGGAYTVEGPLLVGAAFADAGHEVRDVLQAYGRPLGEAFQLRDDLRDGEAAPGVTLDSVNDLVERARATLVDAPIVPEARAVLDQMARSVGMA